uniref:Groucho/TLE N-terminal Q-rich domain-containing protein n=1 Tax=Varanus komodoensis TaxID=61221 RepID=A0A8D2JB45_VARKO
MLQVILPRLGSFDYFYYLHNPHPPPPPNLLQSGQPFKYSIMDICEQLKEEFRFLHTQYHSLKLECEKLASEKIEIQRHYVMVREKQPLSAAFVLNAAQLQKLKEFWAGN